MVNRGEVLALAVPAAASRARAASPISSHTSAPSVRAARLRAAAAVSIAVQVSPRRYAEKLEHDRA
ncbi:MAG: hypothetical protein ACRDSG_08680 [Pseudonocardiaceae bacterium]